MAVLAPRIDAYAAGAPDFAALLADVSAARQHYDAFPPS